MVKLISVYQGKRLTRVKLFTEKVKLGVLKKRNPSKHYCLKGNLKFLVGLQGLEP